MHEGVILFYLSVPVICVNSRHRRHHCGLYLNPYFILYRLTLRRL